MIITEARTPVQEIATSLDKQDVVSEEINPHDPLYEYVDFISQFTDYPESFFRGAIFTHVEMRFPKVDRQTLREFSAKIQALTNKPDRSGRRKDAEEILKGKQTVVNPRSKKVSIQTLDLQDYIAPLIDNKRQTPKMLKRKLSELEPEEQFGADFMRHLAYEQELKDTDPQAPIQLTQHNEVKLARA